MSTSNVSHQSSSGCSIDGPEQVGVRPASATSRSMSPTSPTPLDRLLRIDTSSVSGATTDLGRDRVDPSRERR